MISQAPVILTRGTCALSFGFRLPVGAQVGSLYTLVFRFRRGPRACAQNQPPQLSKANLTAVFSGALPLIVAGANKEYVHQ